MTIARYPPNLIALLFLIIGSFAETTGYPHNDGSQMNTALDEIRKLALNIGMETERLTIVQEGLKLEIKRLRDGMNSTIGKIIPEIQSVRTELTNVEERLQSEMSERMHSAVGKTKPEFESLRTELGNVEQKLEETLHMGIEKAGNRTIDALRPEQQLHAKEVEDTREHPKNCEEIQLLGNSTSGVYRIYPLDFRFGKDVYCDLLTAGGGWTVIQRREESPTNQEDFERTWDEYAAGFGNIMESHWIGLDVISGLTNAVDSELRIELTDWLDENRIATYSRFRIANASDDYRLNLGGYDGDAGNSLRGYKGRLFSTKDHNWRAPGCSQSYRGGWWFISCYSNLNGVYLRETDAEGRSSNDGITWRAWCGSHYSLKRVEMKIRSKDFWRYNSEIN